MRWDEPAPHEREAEERTWEVVRSAWEERIPMARPSFAKRRWPVVAFAAGLAVVAAALSSPGMAVLGSLRDAVRGAPNAKPGLFSLPTGHLLVESERGIWVVQRDGSKRLLAGYRDASWSPHGLYIAAVHGQELRALEPNGKVHWSLARPGRLATPRWSFEGYRIAYRAGNQLRIVNGDGTDDHVLATHVAAVAPSWRPGGHVLAYVDPAGDIRLVDADANRLVRRVHPSARPEALEWSSDSRYLLTQGTHTIELFGPRGSHFTPLSRGAAPVTAATFSPNGHSIAFVQQVPVKQGRRSFLWVYPRIRPDGMGAGRVFAGTGAFGGAEWSPDGRWLLLDWDSADQWLFIRSAAVKGAVPVSNVTANFGRDARFAGWCCP
jgi:dipeptidyl aminopeptidase/acylaminoacyl peptidase